jgi:hypothetical protein
MEDIIRTLNSYKSICNGLRSGLIDARDMTYEIKKLQFYMSYNEYPDFITRNILPHVIIYLKKELKTNTLSCFLIEVMKLKQKLQDLYPRMVFYDIIVNTEVVRTELELNDTIQFPFHTINSATLFKKVWKLVKLHEQCQDIKVLSYSNQSILDSLSEYVSEQLYSKILSHRKPVKNIYGLLEYVSLSSEQKQNPYFILANHRAYQPWNHSLILSKHNFMNVMTQMNEYQIQDIINNTSMDEYLSHEEEFIIDSIRKKIITGYQVNLFQNKDLWLIYGGYLNNYHDISLYKYHLSELLSSIDYGNPEVYNEFYTQNHDLYVFKIHKDTIEPFLIIDKSLKDFTKRQLSDILPKLNYICRHVNILSIKSESYGTGIFEFGEEDY